MTFSDRCFQQIKLEIYLTPSQLAEMFKPGAFTSSPARAAFMNKIHKYLAADEKVKEAFQRVDKEIELRKHLEWFIQRQDEHCCQLESALAAMVAGQQSPPPATYTTRQMGIRRVASSRTL